MLKSRIVGLRCVVLSLSFGALLGSLPVYADDLAELPPPPEDSASGLTSLDDEASAGAELPPPPVPGALEEPTTEASAELPPPPLDATAVETPAGEEIPALPMEGDPKAQADLDVPDDSGLMDVPSAPSNYAAPREFSSSSELGQLSMDERIKSKDLVLWLSLGPSYGTLDRKGSYGQALLNSGAKVETVGGLGYNVGIGGMLTDFFQLQFDFTGTPLTKNSTVDQAMFGFGPRFGFLTMMGTFGVQQGPDPTADNSMGKIFTIGVRGGLDLVLKHSTDSRVSIGLSPEVYYIVPQGSDGYGSMGLSVSLRIYGYDNPF